MEINQVKIAVIEDDENMRLLIAQRLIQEGFQVIEAAEGNAAQALILEEQPHIVLLDWMLPCKSIILAFRIISPNHLTWKF